MSGLTRSIIRRKSNSDFLRKYFVGKGIDIGPGPDPLTEFISFFPLLESVELWDLGQGDAQFMERAKDESFDFVHSSHCLEHLHDPFEGIKNWFRILKPGGYLVVTIPDEDLYEQWVFPSTYNPDHKCTFTIHKKSSWCSKSINVIELLQSLESAQILKIELLEDTYRNDLETRSDQTNSNYNRIGECAIEFIVKKIT